MIINQNYVGLDHFFANPWSILIAAKHVLAVFSERAFLMQISDKKLAALNNFQFAVNINPIPEVIIVVVLIPDL